MTIQRRPRPQWRKRAAALAAGGLVLYLVAATAASPTAASAWEAVSRRGDVALRLLQSQLAGGWNASGLPVEAALVIGQSPVLRSNQDAVRNLLRTEEDDDSGLPEEPAEDAVLPGEPAPPAAPVTETPRSAPVIFRTPSAIALAHSSETGPYVSRISCGTWSTSALTLVQ